MTENGGDAIATWLGYCPRQRLRKVNEFLLASHPLLLATRAIKAQELEDSSRESCLNSFVPWPGGCPWRPGITPLGRCLKDPEPTATPWYYSGNHVGDDLPRQVRRCRLSVAQAVGAMLEPETQPDRFVAEPTIFLQDLTDPGRDFAAASRSQTEFLQ
jgi:hypothetical protein